MEEVYEVTTDVTKEIVDAAADTTAKAAKFSGKSFAGGIAVGVASTFLVKGIKKGACWVIKKVKASKEAKAKKPVDGPIDGTCEVVDEETE